MTKSRRYCVSGAGGKTSECGQRMDSCTRLQGGGQGERVPGGVQNRDPRGVQMNKMPGAGPTNMSDSWSEISQFMTYTLYSPL